MRCHLAQHDNLETFIDAEAYDRTDRSDTGVAFYAALAQETGGPVLDLACGTGRVGIPIARLGFAVTGVDIVPGMVAVARRNATGLPARWVVGDARTFNLGERFRLVFMTGNAVQLLLTRPDQEAMLARVRAHLHADGVFAFETRMPRWSDGATVHEVGEGVFFCLDTRASAGERAEIDDDGREVYVSTAQAYDQITQVLWRTTHRRWTEGGVERVSVTRLALRYTFPQELESLLHHNGFAVWRRFGDFDGRSLTAASPSMVMVCRARGRGSDR